MQNIFKSASKICLLLAVVTLCVLMGYGAITKQLDYKDLTIAFVALLSALQGFYFANKGESGQDYLGK
ncbi:hypothetical protein [Caudoviricetes sp.]|nr:hypothetical protein [Caudoviricetes sp.]